MRVYDKFSRSEHNFNVLFSTSLATVSSIIIGVVAILLGMLKIPNLSVVVFSILVIVPIIVYLTVENDTEFHSAYYKTWLDRITGRRDQRKIIDSFAKKYKLDDSQINPKKFEADGRWHFRANTSYMNSIVNQRNLLLTELSKEYMNSCTSYEKRIIDATSELEKSKKALESARNAEEETRHLEHLAKTAAEKYFQHEQLENRIAERNKRQAIVSDYVNLLSRYDKELDNLHEQYTVIIAQVNKVFNERYTKYTDTAIKKINRIHGLKYTILAMSEVEKEIK